MPEGNQGNGSQGQESGAGNQGQGQESASQQGQQSNENQQGQQGGQGQESGQQQTQQGGQQGQGDQAPDFSSMTEEQLREYAAKAHKDLGQTRREAANYRTQYQAANQKVTEAERAQMSELEKAQTDLTQAQSTVQERDTRIQELEGQVEDLTRGAAIRDALTQAGALNPATAYKVGDWKDVKLAEDGTLDAESAQAALQALRTSDPYLFRRGGSADAGAGRDSGSPEAGSSINDFVRGSRRG